MPDIPRAAQVVLDALERSGVEAWVVGGWVRDALLGSDAHDVDVATSAAWEDAARLLADAGLGVHETGTAHGTVTAVVNGVGVEVTTYRVESGYSDHRHPDEVRFVDDVREDLARRDFTINAIAYHPERGMLDPFGGADDLAAGVIRAVGDADERFGEDALRVLRAVRFACRLGFAVEPDTRAALDAHAEDLAGIAWERIGAELDATLATGRMGSALREHAKVLAAALPELAPCVGFDQHSTYHHLDVLAHTAAALDAVEIFSGGLASARLRWAALMHDIAKPACCRLDDEGHGHFHGHPEESALIAEKAMRRMALPLAVIRPCCALVRLHDNPVPSERTQTKAQVERAIRRLLIRLERLCPEAGEPLAHELIVLKQADALAHARPYRGWSAELESVRQAVRRLFNERAAFSIADLAIGGADVMEALGCAPGPEVGAMLASCLDAVAGGEVPNERDALLGHVAAVAERRLPQC